MKISNKNEKKKELLTGGDIGKGVSSELSCANLIRRA
jgi:hypothetical protein